MLPVATYWRSALRTALTFYILIFACNLSRANHVAGGHIALECLSGDSVRVIAYFYRDCSGIPAPNNLYLNAFSNCGQTIQASPALDTSYQASHICDSLSGQTTCDNGFLPGYEIVEYSTILVLSGCTDWDIGFQITATAGFVNVSGSLYIESHYQSSGGCNSSPIFYQPFGPRFGCTFQPHNFNVGATDPEGDSLVFSLVSPLNGPSNTIYNSYLPGMVIDPTTGIITYTPTIIGAFLIAVQVDQYDQNGVWLGAVTTTFPFTVISCTSAAPIAATSAFSSSSSTSSSSGQQLSVCSNQPVNFTVGFVDSLHSLDITTNLLTHFPGATLTDTMVGDTLFVTAAIPAQTSNPGSKTIYFTADNGACPIPGITSSAVTIHFQEGVSAGLDQTICGSQQAQLEATGSAGGYTWTVISGDPIQVGTNFSCTSCPNPVATPSQTTVYQVQGTTSNGCANTDLVTVSVTPPFTSTVSASDGCFMDSATFSVSLVPAGNYTYQWSATVPLDTPQVATPVGALINPGTQSVSVVMTDSNGCSQTDSTTFFVTSLPAPVLTVTSDLNILGCANPDTAQLNVQLEPLTIGSGSCALTGSTCNGTPAYGTIGTALLTNTGINYPAPFGNFFWGAKHQFLIRASELTAAGIEGGDLTSLAFDVASLGNQTVFQNFTVKMGCSQLTELNSFQTGLETVFPSQTWTTTTGWNTFNFANHYGWDGQSNLIVEVCFNNGNFVNNGNARTRLSPTSFNSTIYYTQDLPNVCSSPGTPVVTNLRSNMRLGQCQSQPNPNAYNYTWSPAGSLSDPSVANPLAFPGSSTTYAVTVTDTLGGCQTTDSIALTVPVLTFGGAQATPETCFGDGDGEINIWAWSNLPIMYSIYGGNSFQTANTFTNLNPGSYAVVVQVDSVCLDTATVLVNGPTPVVVSVPNDTIICSGSALAITATASGGNGPPYSIDWGIAQPGPTITVSPAQPTVFQATASDLNGCSDVASVMIDLHPQLMTSATADTNIIQGDSITLCAQGLSGVPPYTFAWSNGAMDSCIAVSPATTTTYAVTVSDACADLTSSITVTVDSAVSVGQHPIPTATFKAYPNPFREVSTVEFDLTERTWVELEITDLLGNVVTTLNRGYLNPGPHQSTFRGNRGRPNGVYFVRLQVNDQTQVLRLVEIR